MLSWIFDFGTERFSRESDMKYNPISRRMFLQGAGSTMLAIPFLPSMLPRSAWGQTIVPPKRFISVVSEYDIGHNSNWYPNLGTNYWDLQQPNRTNPSPG